MLYIIDVFKNYLTVLLSHVADKTTQRTSSLHTLHLPKFKSIIYTNFLILLISCCCYYWRNQTYLSICISFICISVHTFFFQLLLMVPVLISALSGHTMPSRTTQVYPQVQRHSLYTLTDSSECGSDL